MSGQQRGQQLAPGAVIPPPATEVPPPPAPPVAPAGPGSVHTSKAPGSYSATVRGPQGFHVDTTGAAPVVAAALRAAADLLDPVSAVSVHICGQVVAR